jgi:hypothetical protein
MIVTGTLVANPGVTVPAEAITTEHGLVLIAHDAALTALLPMPDGRGSMPSK